jgi:YD repeat-containing protein
MNEYDPPTATNVGTRVTTYAYDTERKPTLITRPDGQTVDFDYDTAGRLSSLNLPSRQLTYGYHATTSNLTSITDSTGSSLAHTYDGSLPKSATWNGPGCRQCGRGTTTTTSASPAAASTERIRSTSATTTTACSLKWEY